MKKGFSIIEIIISLSILGIVFSFMFYFVTSIHVHIHEAGDKPYIVSEYNYANIYCPINEEQLYKLSIARDVDLSSYISTSTPVTSIGIFDGQKIILTTNSSSTTEPDIFIFDLDFNLLYRQDVGPGITDALLHDNYLYVLNTSVNSHVKTFLIGTGTSTITIGGDIKINELVASHALPKRIYLFDKKVLIGTEKNNFGGELFILPLDQNNIPQYPLNSLEIGGQVSGIYGSNNELFIANASGTELFMYDKHFKLQHSYDAPLSLGNGKSVYYLEPMVYLGRTVASFELFLLQLKDTILNFTNKYKAAGTIDFIQPVGQFILLITSTQNQELQFFTKSMFLIKAINLPSRVEAYTCLENSLIFAQRINDQSHIIWLQ